MTLKWDGKLQGHLILADGSSIHNASELLAHLQTKDTTYTDSEFRFLGTCVLFLAVRDSRHENGASVVRAAEKYLDSFYPVLPNPDRDRPFQEGISQLQTHLSPVGRQPGYVIAEHAFSFLVGQLSEIAA